MSIQGQFRLHHGDCLEIMPTLEAGIVDMVLADPPYGTMEGAQLDGWVRQSTQWDIAIEPSALFNACNRVLRMNGGLALFSQEPYTSALITNAHGNLPFSYRMVWVKDHFANALIAKKAPVSYFEDICLFFKKYDTLGQHPMRNYSLTVLEHCGGNLKAINTTLGHRKAEHFFYVESTQFGMCTQETYSQLCAAYGLESQPWFKPYSELEAINRRFNRRFNLPVGQKYKSNVLTYKKDYGGLHPTQKPVALMEDLIRTYTNESDTVLDFTMGSGTTGVACANTGRKFIGIELDAGYFEIAKDRIINAYMEASKEIEQ